MLYIIGFFRTDATQKTGQQHLLFPAWSSSPRAYCVKYGYMCIFHKFARSLTIIACALAFIPAAFADPGEPVLVLRLEASRAENLGSYSPNSADVYPVRLRWQKPATAEEFTGYHVYRSARANSGFERITSAPVEKESGGFFTFIDQNLAAVAGKPFYYRVQSLNARGGTSLYSETVMGWGALTHERYFREYDKTVLSSQQKLTLMHKLGGMSKLGKEEKQGSISGSVLYNAQAVDFKGRVIIQYDRYADFYIDNNSAQGPYFVLTGNMNTSASMSRVGTMDGTVQISGMYPGRVYYDNIQIKGGVAGGGTYGVEPEGFPRAELSWTIIGER